MSKRILFLVSFTALIVWTGLIFAAERTDYYNPFPEKPSPPRPGYAIPGQELPDGYERYLFGMKRGEVIRLVSEDTNLVAYDADFIEGFEQEEWTVLIAVGPPLIDTAWFVFNKNEELYNIILRFNAQKFSYTDLLNALQKKYGRSRILGQDRTVWQNEHSRIQLERDLHVKYIDLARFAQVSREFRPELYQIRTDKVRILDML
ncbi:MAG: hypothetical protein LBC99_03295 [Spirochaetota bacterium]|nr:hypothetical protein [Spirochaetota bacterium]